MKKVIPGLVCLLLITTCGFENFPPESITIKGSPELYIPLGSPFAGMEEDKKLENLIGQNNIKKMMNNIAEAGVDSRLTIYEVGADLAGALGIDPEVQTYLARYSLAKMPLNLEAYTKGAMDAVNNQRPITIPTVSSLPANPTYITEEVGNYDIDKPFIRIPLDDMSRLVKEVKRSDNGIFGLEIDYRQELENNLKLKIPGFGIVNYMSGIPYPPGNPTKLRYYDTSGNKKMFYPRGTDLTEGNLLIYASISAPFQQLTLTPQLIFDWEKALIDTRPDVQEPLGSLTREYLMNNSISEFLGNGVSFKKVDGYLYMSGVNVYNSSMSIKIYDSNNIFLEETQSLTNVNAPTFPEDNEDPGGDRFQIFKLSDEKGILREQDKMSLDAPIDLSKTLEVSNATLQVGIFIKEMVINKSTVGDTAIQFDLLILIPLDFNVSGVVDSSSDIGQKYVPLDLGNSLKKKPGGEGDLFGRKEGEDNYLKEINYVNIRIKFSDSDITITDPKKLAILVESRDYYKLLEFNDNESLTLDSEFLEYPFNPKFSVLLEKDQGKNSGSFKILRQEEQKPSFDFKLYIEAKAELEYTIDF